LKSQHLWSSDPQALSERTKDVKGDGLAKEGEGDDVVKEEDDVL
jgi:hypothetical protein